MHIAQVGLAIVVSSNSLEDDKARVFSQNVILRQVQTCVDFILCKKKEIHKRNPSPQVILIYSVRI